MELGADAAARQSQIRDRDAAQQPPRRLDDTKKVPSEMGGEMKQFCVVMGELNFVGICEVPDDIA